MTQKLDDKELVYSNELMMANAIQLDAVTQLLIEKSNHHGGGVFTPTLQKN